MSLDSYSCYTMQHYLCLGEDAMAIPDEADLNGLVNE